MLSKHYESTVIDGRTWLLVHMSLGVWSTSSGTHQVVVIQKRELETPFSNWVELILNTISVILNQSKYSKYWNMIAQPRPTKSCLKTANYDIKSDWDIDEPHDKKDGCTNGEQSDACKYQSRYVHVYHGIFVITYKTSYVFTKAEWMQHLCRVKHVSRW